jgi:mannose-6-phosphate isomerase-like protein (cupin superfamily)
MSRHAFFIAGNRIVRIANATGAGFQYQAQSHALLPQVQIGPHMHDNAETVIVVEDGIVEVMINGLAGFVGAGSFVRVPAGTHFAYRNAGDDVAHVLCRTSPAPVLRDGIRVTVELTAA